MKILLLGNGGREHALAWKLSQSPQCQQLFIAPGNAGTARLGTNVDLKATDFPGIAALALQEQIDLIIVGPEQPLVAGIVDHFAADPTLARIPVFGPDRAAAQLEGSKAFAKKFMRDHNIPTAAYREFTEAQLEEGLQYLDEHPLPIVLKADGLAAGKGVLILQDRTEAKAELRAMLQGKFGAASQRVVVEEFLEGIECSVFAITDGRDYQLLPTAKDYKRVGEGDTGLNTGGMGSISPVPFLDDTLLQRVKTRIVEPTIRGIQERHLRYRGFLFFGLIVVQGAPYVIEYNCRLGDPETQSILPRMQGDLLELIQATLQGSLSAKTITIDPRTAASVILVSGGYPGAYEKGKTISGLQADGGPLLFHAGTRRDNGNVLTNGGRVLAVTALADNQTRALKAAYARAADITFEGKYYRSDIGFDL